VSACSLRVSDGYGFNITDVGLAQSIHFYTEREVFIIAYFSINGAELTVRRVQ